MKLIVIRGKKNYGKSTLCVLLHNELVMKGAYMLYSSFDGGKSNIIPFKEDGSPNDFSSVLKMKTNVVAIISAGDEAKVLKEKMDEIRGVYHPDIMVVCTRTKNRSGSSIRMLQEEFPKEYRQRSEVWTIFSDNPIDKIDVKRSVVDRLISLIEFV